MRVVLTGATGFLGYRTLEKLVQCNFVSSVIAAGRNLKNSHKVQHEKISYLLGDLANENYVAALVAGADVVIHAAALSSPWGKKEAFVRANLLSQELLIKAALQNKVKRFIYVSTPSIYFNGQHRLLVKESDPLPAKFVNWYAATKYQAEVLLEKAGIPYIILRPRALTGRGDTVIMPRLIRAFDEGRLKIIGSGNNVADLTSVANAAEAIVLSLNANEEALNNAYNISNGQPVQLWSAIERVLKLLGKKMSNKKIPYGLVLFVAQLMELKAKLSNGKEPALTKYGAGTLAKSMTLDISKARKKLKYEPRVTTDEAIEEFVNWYIQHERS